MTLKQIFGKNVKYYRYQKNYTQEKFTEKVDLNASYISELESGKYGPNFEKNRINSKSAWSNSICIIWRNEKYS